MASPYAPDYARPCSECGRDLTGWPLAQAAQHRIACRPDDGTEQIQLGDAGD